MAGVEVGVAYVNIKPDLTKFSAELKAGLSKDISAASESTSQSLKKSFGDAAKIAAGAFAGVKVADFLKGSVQAASDLAEAVNVTGLTFGEARGEIDKFVKSAAGIGLSETAARELSSSIGGLLKNMGLSTAQTVTWSKTLLELGSDLGSAFNADPADAIQAIGAALRGETEPIRRFNVVLDDMTVRQKAVELGLARSTSEVSKQAKTMATLQLITEQTKDAQGDFKNTADGLANSQRQLAANMENLKATLGQALLPVIARGTGLFNDLLSTFNELPGPVREVASALLLAAGAMSAAGIAAAVMGPKIAAARLELEAMGAAGAVANKSIGVLAALGKGVAAVAIPVGAAAALNSQINQMTGDVKKLAEATDEELLPAFDRIRQSRNLMERTVELFGDADLYSKAEENQAAFKKVVESGNLVLAQRILTAVRGKPVEKDLQAIWDQQVGALKQLNQEQTETAAILDRIVNGDEKAKGANEKLAESLKQVGAGAGDAKDGLDALKKVDLSEWAQGVQRDIEGALDPSKRNKPDEDLTFGKLRDNLKGNLADVTEWKKDLERISTRGFPLLAGELAELGPGAAKAVDEATRAGKGALQKMQDEFVTRAKLIGDATVTALEDELGGKLGPVLTQLGSDAAVFFGKGFTIGLSGLRHDIGNILAGGSPLLPKTIPPAEGGLLGTSPTAPGFGVAATIPTSTPAKIDNRSIVINNTFNEKIDPALVGKAVAWQLR